MEETTIDLRPREHDPDGQVTRWLEHGRGPTVVLVHGSPTSPRGDRLSSLGLPARVVRGAADDLLPAQDPGEDQE